MEPKIEAFFAALPSGKRELALQVREIILSADKRITETIKWNQLTFVANGNLAFVYTYKTADYINLGFMKAVQLNDPKGLLEGSGKGMRHLKIYSKKDISTAQIKKWAKEAVKLNEAE